MMKAPNLNKSHKNKFGNVIYNNILSYENEDIINYENGKLENKYLVPPFSILDSRKGYWKERKEIWNHLIHQYDDNRKFNELIFDGDDEYKRNDLNFDPVLVELIYLWFGKEENTRILDPFCGEHNNGIIAGELGLKYYGVDIRADQIELNKKFTHEYSDVNYFHGDSNYLENILSSHKFNLCISSPPYYDLEVYDFDYLNSLGGYDEFLDGYRNIFQQVYNLLEDNSFLVLKLGEIRDSFGVNRGFLADNIKIMQSIGFAYYNEIILILSDNTAFKRANNYMKNRKVVKVHQNILVFYKGDVGNIQDNFNLFDGDYL